jgi:hypothetical protein
MAYLVMVSDQLSGLSGEKHELYQDGRYPLGIQSPDVRNRKQEL